MRDDQLAEMADAKYHLGNTVATEQIKLMIDERAPSHGYHCFGYVLCDGMQTRSKAAG